MSVGNLKDYGNKGNNMPFQLANLKLLGGIQDAGNTANGTLLSILAALQAGQNFSTALVEDQGGTGCPTNCPVYTEVRVWNGTSFDPPVYYKADGTIVVPVGPVVYINPDFHLAQMVVLLTAINNSVDVNLSTRNAEATQLLIKALLTSIDADTSNLDVALSTRATEATQLLVKGLLTAQTTRVHHSVSATGAGTVPASMRGSVMNVGNAAGTWNGISLPAGVSIPWDAIGNRDTYAAISYDASGTTFIIEYTT
jgi:hypothetical protein